MPQGPQNTDDIRRISLGGSTRQRYFEMLEYQWMQGFLGAWDVTVDNASRPPGVTRTGGMARMGRVVVTDQRCGTGTGILDSHGITTNAVAQTHGCLRGCGRCSAPKPQDPDVWSCRVQDRVCGRLYETGSREDQETAWGLNLEFL